MKQEIELSCLDCKHCEGNFIEWKGFISYWCEIKGDKIKDTSDVCGDYIETANTSSNS